MKYLFTIHFFLTSFLINAIGNEEKIIQSFYQGEANNCVSVALIKAAIGKYGLKGTFELKNEENKYMVTLKDQTKLTISVSEYDLAKKYSRFEFDSCFQTIPNKDEVEFYLYLYYAVIAKNIEKNGYWGCDNDNSEPYHYKKIKNYQESLDFITRTGFCADNCFRVLGLRIKDNKVQLISESSNLNRTGIIMYSWKHAVAVNMDKFDCYGEWLRVEIGKTCNQRFEFYIELI